MEIAPAPSNSIIGLYRVTKKEWRVLFLDLMTTILL